jgi:predicted Zn-dependent peptidase
MRKHIFAALCISFVLSAFEVTAQKQYRNIQEVKNTKYPYTFIENDPANARFYTLPNGLSVILSRNTEEPKIQTLIAVKAGSKNDPAEHTGLAHYLEHMLFKGTDKYGTLDFEKESVFLKQIDSLYSVYNKTKDENYRKAIYKAIDSVSLLAAAFAIPNEYDKLMQIIGAEGTNAFTSFEQTVYVNTIPSNELHRWVSIEAERFRNPILRLFHTELEAVYEEKNISMDNDQSKVFESLLENLFKEHNYGQQTTIGTVEHLKNPSLQAIRDYYNRYYVPNNMAIIMAGELDFDATIEMIASHFAYMQAKEVPTYTFKPETPRAEPINIEITGPSSEMVFMGFRLPGESTKESHLLRMMDMVLSNSAAGLIDLNLNMQQKVLQAGCSPLILKDYSVHYFYGLSKQGQSLEDVQKLLLQQIDAVKRGDFDEALLKGIIFNNVVQEIESFEENQGVAYTLLDNFVTEGNWIDRLNLNYALSQITKEDLMNFAKNYYQNDFVTIYKRQGPNPVQAKIEKPEISSIPVNRDQQSKFVSDIIAEKTELVSPLFIDFEKDMQRSALGPVNYFHIPNNRNDLFELYYVIEMGDYHSKSLSFALEYLEYLGTDKYSPEAIKEQFYQLGCNFNVSSSSRFSYVTLSGLQENFEKSVALFEHLLQNVKGDDEVLLELKGSWLKSRENNMSSKGAIRNALNNYAAYGPKNPSRFNLTNKEVLKLKSSALLRELKELQTFKHDIVYYGPANQEAIKSVLNKHHPLPSVFKNTPKAQVFIPKQPKKQSVFFAHYDMVQAEITWNAPTIEFSLSTSPVSAWYNEYFGGGMSSIVFQEIREARALAYSTFSRWGMGYYPGEKGRLIAYVGTQADKMHQAIEAMDELLRKLPVNEMAMDQSRNAVLNSIRTSRISKSGIYFSWRTQELMGLTQLSSQYNFEKLPALSKEDLLRFHNEYIKNAQFTLSVLANQNSVTKKDLAKYGKVKQVKTSVLFGY